MKLTLNQIKQITSGAERIEEEDNLITFNRFTKEQEEMFRDRHPDYYRRSFATAGIKLSFVTDSKRLYISGNTVSAFARRYYSIDVFVDKNMLGAIDNFSQVEMVRRFTGGDNERREFSKEFNLGDGRKTVDIYLPWTMRIELKEMVIDDDAYLEPALYTKKLLAYGDSITQGFDALRPSNRYISMLADKIQAQEINKAIGGEVFFPPLAMSQKELEPDYITVAYGTNDWAKVEKKDFEINCKTFYEVLSSKYPTAKIFAISPIWRKDLDQERKMGPFSFVEEYIKEVASNLENVIFISGYDFVPEDEKFFADLVLHPNDEGFKKYFESLYKKIEAYL